MAWAALGRAPCVDAASACGSVATNTPLVPKHPQISAAWGLLLTLGGVIQDLQPQTGSDACYEMKLCRKPRTLSGKG